MSVGFCVDVSVRVGVNVIVVLAVGLTVGLAVAGSVGVKTTRGVVDGKPVGVNVGGVSAGIIKVDMSASRTRIPMMIGIAYLRNARGKVAVGTTGSSPVYPKAVNRLLRLAGYSSDEVKSM